MMAQEARSLPHVGDRDSFWGSHPVLAVIDNGGMSYQMEDLSWFLYLNKMKTDEQKAKMNF